MLVLSRGHWRGLAVTWADALDLATRSVLGYAMADHMRTSLVVDALRMAAGRIHLPEGASFHSDRGSPVHLDGLRRRLDQLGVTRSMGRTGAYFDNAAAESFWAILKREPGRCWWPTRAPARHALFEYMASSTTASAGTQLWAS